MINWVQKILYKIACIAPIVIVFGISLIIQYGFSWQSALIVLAGIVFSVYPFWFVKLCRKKLPPLNIEVENIAQNDGVAVLYVFTYIVPLAEVVWTDKRAVWILIACLVIVFLIKQNHLDFCPILMLADYHCYKAGLSTGIEECMIISRQKRIRNTRQIKVVLRVGESLLIDEGGAQDV